MENETDELQNRLFERVICHAFKYIELQQHQRRYLYKFENRFLEQVVSEQVNKVPVNFV